jgi:hypothetical protein
MTDAAPKAETLNVDFNRLTLGDMEDFEDLTGKPFMQTMEGITKGSMASVPIKTLTALVFLVKRIENPAFTIEDARKVRVTDLVFDLGGEPDPTEAAG